MRDSLEGGRGQFRDSPSIIRQIGVICSIVFYEICLIHSISIYNIVKIRVRI